ncbi:hypothetical protein BY458DRAFT_519376 [Sporodiniella umbellata]|nr:hypothetical protein BY458DRAFT_519376 [Sporodiniella umbellata]
MQIQNTSRVKEEDESSRKEQDAWQSMESYYVNRLNSLQAEIEQATMEDQRLQSSRDELLKEVVRLTQKSTELSLKNEALTRIIAEKENKITAFMYESKPTLYAPPMPSPPHSPPVSLHDDGPTEIKKTPSLFRRLSFRLSVRRPKQKPDSLPDASYKKRRNLK